MNATAGANPEADAALAAELVAGGWYQTSARYRTVARIAPPRETFAPEITITLSGALEAAYAHNQELFQRILDNAERSARMQLLRGPESPAIERRELSITEFQAFKRAGGKGFV